MKLSWLPYSWCVHWVESSRNVAPPVQVTVGSWVMPKLWPSSWAIPTMLWNE
jgi:hypothetical protein